MLYLSATVFLSAMLAALTYIDVTQLVIPDELNIVLAISGLTVRYFEFHASPLELGASMVFIYLAGWAIAHGYEKLRGQRGIGGGDIKFLAAATGWIGLEQLPWLVLIASVSGLVLTIMLSALGKLKSLSQRVPFGPYLALGLLGVWLLPS